MQTEPTGNSRALSPSALQGDVRAEAGSHNYRQVAEQQGLVNSLSQTPSENTFQTLKQRGITPKPLSGGAVSTLASVLTPMALAGMDVSTSKTRGSMKKGIENLKARQAQGVKRIPAAAKELSRIKKKLEALRGLLDRAMNPKQIREYQTLLDSAEALHRELAELEAKEPWYAAQKELLGNQLEQFSHQTEQSRALTKAGVHAGAKVIGGMRNVYQPDPASDSQAKVSIMHLGDLKMEDQGHYSVSLQDMSIAIEQFQRNKDGSVTLNVAECSAKCTALDKNGDVTGPVRFSGGLKVTVKEPLAELVDQLMKCSLVKLPFRLKGMTADFEKRAQKALGDLNGKKPDIRDFIDFEISALNIDDEEAEQVHNILSRQGIDIILHLLNPVVSSYKDMADDKLKTSMKAGSSTLNLEIQRREKRISRLEGLASQMEADLGTLSDQDNKSMLRDKSILREMLSNKLSQLKYEMSRAHQSLVEYRAAGDVFQKRMLVNEKWRKSDRNEWVEGYTNLSHVLLALREAESKATEASPVVLKCPLQRIPLGAMAHLDVVGMEASITGVDLDESGALTVSVPEMKARLAFENDLTSETRDTPVTLKGLKITIEPPLGTFIRDTLKLDFPLDVRRIQKLNELMSEIWPSTDHQAHGKQTQEPKLDELLHLNFDDVSITRHGEETFSSEGFETDKDVLSDAASQLLGAKVESDSYEQLMGKLFKPESPEFKKLMHFLAMSVMGAKGEVRTPHVPETLNLPEEDATASPLSRSDSGIEVVQVSDTTSVQDLPLTEELMSEIVVPEISVTSLPETEITAEPTVVPTPVLDTEQDSLNVDELSLETVNPAPLMDSVPEEVTDFEKDAVNVSIEKLETITAEELRSTEGIKPSFILDKDNKPKAVFELQTNLDNLLGKISWFWKLLIGSRSVDLEVTTIRSRRGVELQDPIVHVKKAGVIRRYAVNRLLKAAMRKRRVSLVVDYSGDKRRIDLILDALRPVAIKR